MKVFCTSNLSETGRFTSFLFFKIHTMVSLHSKSIPTIRWLLTITLQMGVMLCCENYWQSVNEGASSSRRPFDVCYRSYRRMDDLDYSYRYICNETYINDNYTVNGYTVYKQFFSGVGCEGEANATFLEDTLPFSVYCGGSDCDLVRYRVYDMDSSNDQIGLFSTSHSFYNLLERACRR